MKRTITLIMTLFICLLVLGIAYRGGRESRDVIIMPTVHAQSSCSNATLNGSYRYIFNGVGLPAAGPIHPTGATLPFAAAGIVTFHGDGTLSGHDTASLSGNVLNRVYTGPYTVNADCTGSTTLNFCPGDCSGPADLVVAPDGSEVLLISTIHGATVIGEIKKQ